MAFMFFAGLAVGAIVTTLFGGALPYSVHIVRTRELQTDSPHADFAMLD